MNVYILSVMFSIIFLVMIIELVRRRRLKEQYSLLWILMGFTLLIISVNVQGVERLASFLQIEYAPALLFLFGLLFCFVLILHLTLVITKLSAQVLRLTQEIAIMKGEKASHNEHIH
ncbi:DUF2304 domain-containing protein [Paenibacillus sp. F411]|uniref:DUF2304 domain-containing protein n=1 Tax=Paenibacillus sp. F411 TaxID=2820239 RepID=UPI001AAE3C1C|nr:DUF2304 domain-containing protein [Paenibacillus sp. F411]MBO2942863.1 DUF2304 domain-containing protein [Paenibacillus sp. F411]